MTEKNQTSTAISTAQEGRESSDAREKDKLVHLKIRFEPHATLKTRAW
jgi:hypothetical protein